jgi:proto-oncogene tyrosine-protein kinase ROS
LFSIIPTDADIAALPHFRRDQLTLSKFLGSGAFGEVFQGIATNIISEESGDTSVAVKV